MLNFTWHIPTRFLFGRDTVLQVGEECKKHGQRVLIMYGGGSVVRSGLLDRVKANLKDSGVAFTEYGGVEPNPRIYSVREATKIAKEFQADMILAVGGGSVIDAAKACSLAVFYNGDPWEIVNGAKVEKALPIGCVLTIPAAGSESSDASVISSEDGYDKLCFFSHLFIPRFAILDPTLTYTLPPYQTACGVADMMAHVMERYFTPEKDVLLTDYLCEAILKTIIECTMVALEHPEDYNARSQIMWAGTIAHNNTCGVGRLGDWASHAIEHELSAKYGIPHGAGLAIMFPAWMKYVYHNDLERFCRFAYNVWGVQPTDDKEADALHGIAATEAFFKSIGLPVRLSDINAAEGDIEELASRAFEHGWDTLGTFVTLRQKDVHEILRLAL